MKVAADFVCEHGMPHPWATCTDCMLLPHHLKPEPPRPDPPPAPVKAARKPRASTRTTTPRAATAGSSAPRGSSPRSSTSRTAAPRLSTRLPRSGDDPIPPLTGQHDLAYEIPDHHLRFHVQGVDKGWLPISSTPTHLRDGGWVYLQIDDRLVARCPVKSIGFRERRWTHAPTDQTSDAGPGATLELFGDDWEFLSVEIGPDPSPDGRGYRYLTTLPDGSARRVDPVDAVS